MVSWHESAKWLSKHLKPTLDIMQLLCVQFLDALDLEQVNDPLDFLHSSTISSVSCFISPVLWLCRHNFAELFMCCTAFNDYFLWHIRKRMFWRKMSVVNNFSTIDVMMCVSSKIFIFHIFYFSHYTYKRLILPSTAILHLKGIPTV